MTLTTTNMDEQKTVEGLTVVKELYEYSYPVIMGISKVEKNAKIIYDELLKQYKGRDIVLCGIGTSGAMIITSILLLANSMKKNNEDQIVSPLFLAKDGESDHRNTYSFNHTFDILTKPVVVVIDDCIASGKTMRKISEMLIEYSALDYVEAVCANFSTPETRQNKLKSCFPKLNLIIG
jgi:hypoxanthine-guanine phosphoribosyltransferase